MKEKALLENIKNKLGIESLNEIQKEMLRASSESKNDLVLLAPTGSGKTLAFLIPLFKALKNDTGKLQGIIIAPSRELVIQIADIARQISEGFRICVCYGGHNVQDEKQSLAVIPDLIISTPGRLLDHINRKNIDIFSTKHLILDEFDKSLELGFQDEMEKIARRMPNLSRKILTSATAIDRYPDFIRLKEYETVDFSSQNKELKSRLTILKVTSTEKDKLSTLLLLLSNIKENDPCIVFVNHRESVDRIYDFLLSKGIPVGVYHGGMDQIEREKAIAMFNNGSFKVLISTDLGARGLDIANVSHIIHYHLPIKKEIFTHRNGRSARISANGVVHVILGPDEQNPAFIKYDEEEILNPNCTSALKANNATLYFQAGKKEKISKGDIVGFLINIGNLKKEDIGSINSHDHYTLVSIPAEKTDEVMKNIEGQKIKNQKVRISIAKQ